MADEAAQTGNDTEPSKVAISVMAAMRRIEEAEYTSGSRGWNQLIFLTNVTEIISTTAGRKVTKHPSRFLRRLGSLQPGTPRLKRILAGFLGFCPPRFCCLGNFLPGCCRESAFGLTSARHPAITNTGNSTFCPSAVAGPRGIAAGPASIALSAFKGIDCFIKAISFRF